MKTLRVLAAMMSLSCVATIPAVAASPTNHAVEKSARAAAPKGSLTATPRTVFTEDTVKFTGILVRGKMNQKAILQVSRDGKWRRVAIDYTNRRGQFRMKVEMSDTSGSYRYRALGKASRLYEVPQMTTRPVRVTVKDRLGSQALPWRPGQPIAVEDWRFTFGITDFDAWPEYLANYSEADPPPPGYTYVSVPMTFTRTGSGSGKAWIENEVEYVGNNGVVYDDFAEINGDYVSCSLATDWDDAPEVYTGGTASGTQCLAVLQSAIPGGMWRLTGGYSGRPQFITPN